MEEEKNHQSTILPAGTSVAKFLQDNDYSSSTFQIPSVLVKNYGGVLPSEATCRIDDSGKSWRIKIEKFRDLYFFTDGWKQFAQDVDIGTRDCLIFNSPGLMSPFRVETSPYKEFNSGDQTDHAEEPESSFKACEHAANHIEDEENGFGRGWRFSNKMKKRKAPERPETSNKTLEPAEGRDSSHKSTEYAKGVEDIHLNINGDNANLLAQEENCFGQAGELEKHNAQEMPESSHKTSQFAEETEVSVKTSVHADVQDSTHKISKFAKGLENIHLKIKSENEDQCQEGTNSPKELNSGDQTEKAENEDRFTDQQNGPIDSSRSFMVELKSYNLNYLELPRKLMNGSILKANSNIILQDVEGREWPVRVRGRSCGRLSITAGWRNFLIANSVVVGSTVSLKFTSCSNNMVEARVVKEGINSKALFSLMKKKGGRIVVCEPDGASGLSKGSGSSQRESYCKASDHAEEPESSFKACEHAAIHMADEENGIGRGWRFSNKMKKRKAPERPETSNKTLEPAEGRDSSHKSTEYAKGVEDIHLNINGDQTENAEDEDRFTHQENGPIDSSWSFMVELKSYNLNILRFPRKLMNERGVKADGNIVLLDVEGRKWPVRVTGISSGSRPAPAITAGWQEFLIANRVVVGSTMSLKFISRSNNVVEARVVKEGTNRKALFSMVKRVGSKFVVCESHSALSEGTGSSSTENQYVDGLAKYCKASDHEDVPETFHEACEQAADHINIVGRRWTFSKELKKHNAYKLDIPRDFSKVIEKTTDGEIKLEDRKGQKWPVRIEHRKCGAYTMTAGWIDFLVGNKVCIGSTVSFEFIPSSDNVIEARVVDTGNARNEPFKKRAKGRPPCS